MIRWYKKREVPSTGQVMLPLELGPPQEVLSRSKQGALFNDPTPDAIYIGETLLKHYLERVDQKWVFTFRKLLLDLDWEPFTSKYPGRGRPAYHPRSMMAIVLYGHLTGQTSLRQMQRIAATDVILWWLTGGIIPDYSSLCRFILFHQEHIHEGFFEDLTRQIVQRLHAKTDTLAIDGTVVQAAASRWRLIQQEAAREEALRSAERAQQEPDNARLQQEAQHAQRVLEAAQERDAARIAKEGRNQAKPVSVSPTEPEAVIQNRKADSPAPSYKPSVAVNAARLILAHSVHPSEEASQVAPLVEQARRVDSSAGATVLADGAYNTEQVHQAAQTQNFELLSPSPKDSSTGQLSKDVFIYDAERDVYVCPEGRLLHRVSKENIYPPRYRTQSCANCPLASKCLRVETPPVKSSAKSGEKEKKPKSKYMSRRTIKRFESDPAKKALHEKMQTAEAQARYMRRQGSVEPVFGELKGVQGLRRFHRRGLVGVRLEFSLHCLAHNVRRLRAVGVFLRLSRALWGLHRPLQTPFRRLPRLHRSRLASTRHSCMAVMLRAL